MDDSRGKRRLFFAAKFLTSLFKSPDLGKVILVEMDVLRKQAHQQIVDLLVCLPRDRPNYGRHPTSSCLTPSLVVVGASQATGIENW